jgi:hypothetical protein
MLAEIERAVRRFARRSRLVLIDAAAGKSYVGLLAAKLLLEPMGRRLWPGNWGRQFQSWHERTPLRPNRLARNPCCSRIEQKLWIALREKILDYGFRQVPLRE